MLEDRLTRLWDADLLPDRDRFDAHDEAQLNQVALHLLAAYWQSHHMEAFATLCSLVRPMLLREARSMAGADAPPERIERMANGVLDGLFCAEAGRQPRVLHLREFARSWMRARCTQPAPEAPERLAYLAAVE